MLVFILALVLFQNSFAKSNENERIIEIFINLNNTYEYSTVFMNLSEPSRFEILGGRYHE